MRTVVLVCISILLAGCWGASRDRWTLGNWFHERAGVQQHAGVQQNVGRPAPTRGSRTQSSRKPSCSALDLKAGRKLSEKCRLELEYKLARAAELRVEGHTIDEIAAIMRISAEAATVLIGVTGSLPSKE